MRIAFAGTPVFAATALQSLLDAGYEVPWLLTQPDRPAGRGMRLQASAVKQAAAPYSVVLQPRGLRLDGRWAADAALARDHMASHPVDAMVVVAYGLILPSWVLQLPKYGCLNIHASLLPRWRGAAPIHRAIEAGDVESGICIMAMDEGLDTGPVYLESRLLLSERETTASLHDRLARLGADSVLEVLRGIQAGTIQTRVQPEHGVTYAHKVQRHESMIRWSDRAIDIDRRVRAFQPFPGTQFVCEGEVIKVLEAFPCSLEGGEAAPLKRVMIEPGETVDASPGEAAVDGSVGRRTDPGTVVRLSGDGVWVSTGDGYLRLGILQRPSGKPLPAETVAKALGWQVGTRLE